MNGYSAAVSPTVILCSDTNSEENLLPAHSAGPPRQLPLAASCTQDWFSRYHSFAVAHVLSWLMSKAKAKSQCIYH